ncbi:MAG: ABC transporter ATP-binding protein, partial [Clostridia bacterium]|nr:ABC transporter ATP-binding protein [Clostridia bacterium]
MLKLTDIKKRYDLDGQSVNALRGITLSFRKNEFVAVLGPSGCGKTTLLNIIGGLDGYTEGSLEIKGVSTKKYSDREWDNYRNHSVGFVFQNYNLIPHQSILANVELALTLSGVKKAERRKRAAEALKKVDLGDQLNKKPSQLSGGQMQRVAIARAIVNDPEILLADEPTGALDSETSVQVMDILREIAADRLVIMVTHNSELAREYATRVIRLKDGLVTDDSMPYTEEYTDERLREKRNRSMSFFTALGLSVNNLLTKKGRTIMTCFAGSIGIIGIALILSVSNGVNIFINKIQEDTLTKYPLTVEAESIDLTAMLEAMQGNASNTESKVEHQDGRVYESAGIARIMKSMTSITSFRNNVRDFKKYIENSDEFNKAASAVRYRYPVRMDVYYTSPDGEIVKSDSESVLRNMYDAMGVSMGGASSVMLKTYASNMNVWEELLPGKNGELISESVTEQYDIVYGRWPQAADEVIIILNGNSELSDFVLYAIGLKSSDEFYKILRAAVKGYEIDSERKSWSYEEICSLSFRLILPCDAYQLQDNGSYLDLSETKEGLSV